jgi:hypothetical protein
MVSNLSHLDVALCLYALEDIEKENLKQDVLLRGHVMTRANINVYLKKTKRKEEHLRATVARPTVWPSHITFASSQSLETDVASFRWVVEHGERLSYSRADSTYYTASDNMSSRCDLSDWSSIHPSEDGVDDCNEPERDSKEQFLSFVNREVPMTNLQVTGFNLRSDSIPDSAAAPVPSRKLAHFESVRLKVLLFSLEVCADFPFSAPPARLPSIVSA